MLQGIEYVITLTTSNIASMGGQVFRQDKKSRFAFWAGGDQTHRFVPVSNDQLSMNTGGFISNHGV